MQWQPFPTDAALSEHAARILLDAIRDNPRIVLGLPTGRSPIGMYDRIITECGRTYHCFRDVTTFNLDEYVGVPADDPASYRSYMQRHLFDHVDIDPKRAHVPDGMARDLEKEANRYERDIGDAGGIDLMFLGLGRNGHIGFNEPGTPFDARTRVVELTESTRHANAEHFPGRPVPTHAITMGIATILACRRVVLLVSGKGKEEALLRLESGAITEGFPASALWRHGDVTVLVAGARG